MSTIRDVDLHFDNHGSVWILRHLTDEGHAWVEEHLPADRQFWGNNGCAVEERYVEPIMTGALDDGLRVTFL